jgi:hypothetical protein
LVDTHPVKDFAHLIGQEVEAIVIKMDEVRNNIVISRKAVMQEANSAVPETFLPNGRRSEMLSQGLTVNCLRPSDTRIFSLSQLSTLTLISFIRDFVYCLYMPGLKQNFLYLFFVNKQQWCHFGKGTQCGTVWINKRLRAFQRILNCNLHI